MRRFLAVKGYPELHQRIECEIEGKSGSDALRAMAYAIRNYSLDVRDYPRPPFGIQ
jgi:hypothetical protein